MLYLQKYPTKASRTPNLSAIGLFVFLLLFNAEQPDI